jgi:hypothetical protein
MKKKRRVKVKIIKICCNKWYEFSCWHNCTFIYCPECGREY